MYKQPSKYGLNTGNDRFEGYIKDLCDTLFFRMGYKYQIKIVKDSAYGRMDHKGTWNGMIGEIIRKVSIKILPKSSQESV